MSVVVQKALEIWGIPDARFSIVAQRENTVFKVTTDKQCFALRLHRQGYRTDQELWSELKWMDAAASGGIGVPCPIPSASGQVLHRIADTQVDMLTWLSGATLTDVFQDLGALQQIKTFFSIGRQMARLHDISDAWTPPNGFQRCAWDRNGLLGCAPLWDRFWENPSLTVDERKLFDDFRTAAILHLAKAEATLDYGLIHADLVSANIMIDDDRLNLIDFDDGGYGFRIFDIATTLLKFTSEPDYKNLRTALIDGYASVRSIDLHALDLFMALRATTYVGWSISRMSEDKTNRRNARFIATAKQFAKVYLEAK